MGEWQPIESAPKDGTRVDLWGTDTKDPAAGKGGIMMAPHWKRHVDCFYGEPRHTRQSGLIMNLPEGWYYLNDAHIPRRVWPTFWMPLPHPPQAKEG